MQTDIEKASLFPYGFFLLEKHFSKKGNLALFVEGITELRQS
jgi:hypothetical protein